MGIKHAHKLTHAVEALSLGNVEVIARHRFSVNRLQHNDTISTPRLNQPTLDIDVSWLYRSRNSITEENRVTYIFNICLQFTQIGISVVLVCDGDQRHHSKRATIERRSKMYNNSIKGYVTRSKLMCISKERLLAANNTIKQQLLEEEKKLSMQIKSLEKADQASKIDVGHEFYLSLCAYVDGIPNKDFGNKGARIYVIKAYFQADSSLAYRLINNISDMSFCNNSDLAMLTGKKCLSIKNFKIQNKKFVILKYLLRQQQQLTK